MERQHAKALRLANAVPNGDTAESHLNIVELDVSQLLVNVVRQRGFEFVEVIGIEDLPAYQNLGMDHKGRYIRMRQLRVGFFGR